MKVLSGALRGRPILFTKNPHLRPTADKVRRAIFDAVRGTVPGSRVLDLFAGTGALGIEALSAGAASATFAEFEKAQVRTLTENLRRLGVSPRATVMCEDAFRVLERLTRDREGFDLVFLDPPYAGELGLKALRALSESPAVRSGALVVWECGKNEQAPDKVGFLRKIRSKRYGDTCVIIYLKDRGKYPCVGSDAVNNLR